MREMKDSGITWFGEIPKAWSIRHIKSIYNIVSGATPKSEYSDFWDGNIRWITPADFKTKDMYVFSGRRNISQQGLMSCSATIIPTGSIVFSKRAPIGTVVINRTNLCTNQGCLSCIAKIHCNNKYFYYFMSVFTAIFELYGSGTTFK